jgi:hypothetical protein
VVQQPHVQDRHCQGGAQSHIVWSLPLRRGTASSTGSTPNWVTWERSAPSLRCPAAFWWYGMTVDIKRVIAGCKVCQRAKASGAPQQRDMQTVSPDHYGMFHRWGIDHAVELPTSSNGNKHCLLCVDYYSKWIEAIPVKDLSAETTLQAFLLHVIARYGTPAEIISDNGTAFKGEFRDFCTRRLIHQRLFQMTCPAVTGWLNEQFRLSKVHCASSQLKSTMPATGTHTASRPS